MTVVLHHVVDGPTEIDAADAPVLVLAGSLGSTLQMWRPNVDELARRLRVIRVDHRGHGGSPVVDGDYTMAELAGDVLATLDSLGVDRFHFCGLSLGGMIGMYLGSEHADRVRSLTLCCTTAFFEDKEPWLARIEAVEQGGTEPLAPTIVQRWYTAEFAATHPDIVAESEAAVAGTSDVGYRGCCTAIVGWDHRERLAEIIAPTLVIGGDADPATPVEPHSRTIAAGVPGAQLEVLAGAHLVTVERAEEATRLILEQVHP